MSLLFRKLRFPQVVKLSNNHLFKKILPVASIGNLIQVTSGQWVHTEHITREQAPINDKTAEERPNFIDVAVDHQYLMSQLLKCSSMREQLLILPSILGLSAADVKQRHSVGDMVHDMLKPFFYDCRIHLFGSTANGFGFKGCDIDMALEISVDDKDLMTKANDDSEIPTIEDVLSGRVSRSYMSRLSSLDKLLFIHTVFLDYYKESTVAPIFIGAFTPIIRFYHDFFQLKVDLTCSNRLALVNTKFLHLYAQLDSRVTPLVMAIRYWAKKRELIGGGLMFNSYCLTLLMIFFLQRRSPPVLPTFDHVLSISDCIMSLDMHDTSYLKLLQVIPPSSNTESIESLFREFFFYYFYFDFDDVLCVKNAKCIRRSEFSDAEYNKKFRYNTICVQDPIKLTHNVANLVDYRNCKKFALEMLYACHLFQGKISPSSGMWGLAALFDRKEQIVSKSNIFDLRLSLGWVSEKRHYTSEDAVLQKAANAVMEIFEKALLFRIGAVEGKNVEAIDGSQLGEEERLFLVHRLYGNDNTWLGRSNLQDQVATTEIPDGEDPLGYERALSLKICERLADLKMHNQRRADDRKCEFDFVCRFYGLKENGDLSLVMKLLPSKGKNFNPILGVFLTEYIPKLLKRLL